MKSKVFKLALLLISLILIVGCDDNKEEESEETSQVIEKISVSDDGEITEGKLEGYHFKETEEVTSRVKIQMENGGVILITLSNADTPITIANFQKLVKEKVYDGLIFHRVIKDFMIQGGDPTGTGYGDDSLDTIKGEFSSNGVSNSLSHTRGVISMARSNDPDSASSQFFIVHADSTYLDGNYASFGKVFAGLDVVDEIAKVETDDNDRPIKEQKIKSIRFIEIIED